MNGGCQPFSSECSNERGETVNLNQSSSRKEIGLFDLGLELNFGRNESGDYGLDSLALGLNTTTGRPKLDSQLVVGIETNRYRIGMFGLNQQPTNLSSFSNSYPSFLASLRAQNLIPSLSWAYTAGACYSKSQNIYLSLEKSCSICIERLLRSQTELVAFGLAAFAPQSSHAAAAA